MATVARHVYRGPQGGVTFRPPDRDARIVVTSTPRFAEIISHKYAEFSSPRVHVDLQENPGRVVSRCLIRDVADAVAAAAMAKEEDWSYALPRFGEPPATVAQRRRTPVMPAIGMRTQSGRLSTSYCSSYTAFSSRNSSSKPRPSPRGDASPAAAATSS